MMRNKLQSKELSCNATSIFKFINLIKSNRYVLVCLIFVLMQIRYRPNAPIVLKGITCTFREGTRVGVVGRTGSGKTTLISALFRLVDPYSGQIVVDGINICSIGLKDLRLKLSIIPQEPTLFRGSIRTNLDPLGIYSEDEIWKVRKLISLRELHRKYGCTVNETGNYLKSSAQFF